jgi:hemerythrin-like metal-binding protein
MAYFDWNPVLDTGITGIDYDHHKLVDALNGIHDLIVHGAPPATIGDALADFHTAAAAHFALEERILEDERHPDLAVRRRTHYRLLDEVRDIMDAYDAGEFSPGERLPETLRQWLSEAIEMDARLFARMNAAGLHRWGLNRG